MHFNFASKAVTAVTAIASTLIVLFLPRTLIVAVVRARRHVVPAIGCLRVGQVVKSQQITLPLLLHRLLWIRVQKVCMRSDRGWNKYWSPAGAMASGVRIRA